MEAAWGFCDGREGVMGEGVVGEVEGNGDSREGRYGSRRVMRVRA